MARKAPDRSAAVHQAAHRRQLDEAARIRLAKSRLHLSKKAPDFNTALLGSERSAIAYDWAAALAPRMPDRHDLVGQLARMAAYTGDDWHTDINSSRNHRQRFETIAQLASAYPDMRAEDILFASTRPDALERISGAIALLRDHGQPCDMPSAVRVGTVSHPRDLSVILAELEPDIRAIAAATLLPDAMRVDPRTYDPDFSGVDKRVEYIKSIAPTTTSEDQVLVALSVRPDGTPCDVVRYMGQAFTKMLSDWPDATVWDLAWILDMQVPFADLKTLDEIRTIRGDLTWPQAVALAEACGSRAAQDVRKHGASRQGTFVTSVNLVTSAKEVNSDLALVDLIAALDAGADVTRPITRWGRMTGLRKRREHAARRLAELTNSHARATTFNHPRAAHAQHASSRQDAIALVESCKEQYGAYALDLDTYLSMPALVTKGYAPFEEFLTALVDFDDATRQRDITAHAITEAARRVQVALDHAVTSAKAAGPAWLSEHDPDLDIAVHEAATRIKKTRRHADRTDEHERAHAERTAARLEADTVAKLSHQLGGAAALASRLAIEPSSAPMHSVRVNAAGHAASSHRGR